MFPKSNAFLISVILSVTCINLIASQEENKRTEESINKRYTFFDYRGTHAIDMAVGSAVVNGDQQDYEFETYFRVGYKHHITSHINVNVTYNKYNIAVKDLYNEGFMSFDLNIEYLLFPYRKFSPFLFAGGGYNASNYFKNTNTKAQGGLGVEFIITEQLGLKLFGEYNYIFLEELEGLVGNSADETLIRIGFGVNIYFGGNKKKEELRKKLKTVINSNLIFPNN